MDWIWEPLIGNLAVSALTISVWLHIKRHISTRFLGFKTAIFGTLLGLGAVATMLLSVEVYPGVFFDLRSSLVGTAALFGGPLAAALSITPPVFYRVYLGGEGAMAGILVMCASSAMGLFGYVWFEGKQVSLLGISLLAASISAVTLLSLQFIPGMASQGLWLRVAAPVSLLSFVATALAGYFIFVARREAAERVILTAALTQSPDFTYVKNRKGQFIAVNGTTARFNGFPTPEAMLGLTDFDIADTDRARRLYDAEQVAMAGRQSITDLEESLSGADGKEHWYTTSKTPLVDHEGQVVGIAGVTRDITHNKQLEADLRDSRNRLDYVLTEMVDGIAMYQKTGTLLFSNDRYRDLFPLTKAVRRPGVDLRDILVAVRDTGEQLDLPIDKTSWLEGALRALIEGGDEQIHMYDGRWLNIRTRPTLEATAIVIVSDITEAKGLELDLRSTTEKLQHLAEIDGLTDLPNRRTFDALLAKEVARTGRSGAPLSLLLLDVDHFKAYNDAYGHQAGDECLRVVGRCLKEAVNRPMDLTARYGGEEFTVVLPDTDEDGAYYIAKTISARLKEANLVHRASQTGRVTVSVGVATYCQNDYPRSAVELIERADQALYGAKMAGRDKINGRTSRNHLAVVRS